VALGGRGGWARNGWTLRGDWEDWGVDPFFMRPAINALGVLSGRATTERGFQPEDVGVVRVRPDSEAVSLVRMIDVHEQPD